MKKLVLLALCFVFMLTACSSYHVEITEPESSALSNEQIEVIDDRNAEQENAEGIFYPMNGGWAWLDGGKTFAAQDDFTVRYINKDNGVENEITLAPKNADFAGRCVFSNERIFMPYSTKNADVSWITMPMAIELDGEWKLYGGAFFERDGSLVRELPYIENHNSVNAITKLSTGEELNLYQNNAVYCEKMLWLGKNIMVFGDNRIMFFYDISADKLTVAVDFRDKVSDDKDGIYYGIYNISVGGNGCFFTYNEDMEAVNLAKLGYTEGSGFEKISEETSTHDYIRLEGDKIFFMETTYNQERDCVDETKVYCFDENNEKKLIADLPGHLQIGNCGDKRVDMTFEHIRDEIHYVCTYDFETDELIKFMPEERGEKVGDYRDVFTAEIGGRLCWFMSEWYDGANHFVIYDNETGERLPLWESPYMSGEQVLGPNLDGSAFAVEKDEEIESEEGKTTKSWVKLVKTESLLKETE